MRAARVRDGARRRVVRRKLRTNTAGRTTLAQRLRCARTRRPTMARTTLTLSSRNYSSWSLRGWLLARFAGLEFEEIMVPADDADARAEMLLLAPSILVPCLRHGGVTVWDTLAIAEYLAEIRHTAG